MRISHFFIDRPIFASVVSIVFIILGGVAFLRLPVAQYPEIQPPIINVSGQYPGANADVIASTVVAPIEEQINGVENMLYMSSNSNGDGRFTIQVTFDIGTNLDIAQVQVQNRVGIAAPRLPQDVRQIGVNVVKSSPDLMLVVHVYSPDRSRDPLYVSNYANLEIKDTLTRVDGVGSLTIFGERAYAMRVWLDPHRLQAVNLTATDVTIALQAQNIQVASGVLNQPPVETPGAFQIPVQTLGRLADPDEFANIVVKTTPQAVVRLKDVARIELAAQDYASSSYLNRDAAVAMAVFQRPGSNALQTAKAIRSTMQTLAKRFPPGISYAIVYDPTQFIEQSVEAVQETILEAILLVVLVVILFLQTWRAAIIPLVAIPISLIGTFFFMALFGFSLNNLSLFGLVLAVGIVVDDAIVVVENVERNIAAGLNPREASKRSMDEVGGALIAIALVLCAVFVPSAFITGISGQFYRQFALTIVGATIISLVVSLTLSPALCTLLLKPHGEQHHSRWGAPIRALLQAVQPRLRYGGARLQLAHHAGGALRRHHAGALRRHSGVRPQRVPQDADGVHPDGRPRLHHRGDAIAARRLARPHRRGQPAHRRHRAEDARRARRHEHRRLLRRDLHQRVQCRRGVPGARLVCQAGRRSGAVGARPAAQAQPRVFRDPGGAGAGHPAAAGRRHRQCWRLPHDGGGPLRPRLGRALQEAVQAMMTKAAETKGVQQVFSLFDTRTPQLYLEIDRTKAQLLGVRTPEVFSALQMYLGSSYVNDFNLFGRTFRVIAQAQSDYRADPKDVLAIRVRNSEGDTVPLGSFTTVRDISGPYRVPRYNLYPAAELDGAAAPGYSQGQAIEIMQRMAAETLPEGFAYEWTTLAFLQLRAGDTAIFAFLLAVMFVFLVLAAQYESLMLPLAVIMIVPMCLIASIVGVVMRGQDNNILTQVGFIVLIALAAKNAILIVEFAKQLEDRGRDKFAAAVEAARLRLRPILMTSFAFIFGVTPLVWAVGAGAELRQTLGTAVFAGMIGVTFFGVIFTPVFYVVTRWIAEHLRRRRRAPVPHAAG